MADSVSHIGMIQAIAVLVFWKEASDCSAWLRIGWAIRIAYQLKLYTPRHHPLPTDVTAAKEQMNLERTWFCLILFDHSYRLHDENNDPPGHTLKDRMGVADWVALNGEQATPGDLRLCASIDSVGTPIEHQLRFHYNWAAVALTKAGLISRGMRDETFLSELIPRVAALVQSLEDLASSANVLERLQDVVAVTLFNLAEFLASLFPCVSNSTQELIVRWMTKVYSTCNSIANGNEESVPAYIQRFYRAVLRHVAFSNLVPPTRTQSRAPSPGAPPIVNPEPPKPFDQLGPLEFELFPDMPSGFQTDDGMVDADYWETLFPGSTDDDWAWLDPTYLNLDDIAVDTTL
ncbi:hypothetical protein MNV49_001597 [Pseudohyphozyma bogoriensis]|nr:hypothetical protein MNV49_001597 [Pseudohyphozyma bogoriensis]